MHDSRLRRRREICRCYRSCGRYAVGSQFRRSSWFQCRLHVHYVLFGAALITYIIRNTFITNFIFSTVFILIYCILYWLFFIIIKDVRGAELSLFTFYLPSALYTIIITPVIYLILRPIKNRLNKPISVLN